MRFISRILRFLKYRLRKTVKRPDPKILLECFMIIRESQVNIGIQLNKLKYKFSNGEMVETICVTACEMQKMERALDILKKEGF